MPSQRLGTACFVGEAGAVTFEMSTGMNVIEDASQASGLEVGSATERNAAFCVRAKRR
jgi:hypothetical protein